MAIKFNSGMGAVVCDFCRIIIKEGDDDNDSRVVKVEFDEFDKKNYLHSCLNCYRLGKCTRDNCFGGKVHTIEFIRDVRT